MKKFTFFAAAILLLFLMNTRAWAQDFTVKVPSTDDYGGYLVPLRAGASIQFQVQVTNNLTDTCTVSIDKSSMGYAGSWVTIDNNSQELLPQQSKNFLLTVAVPTGTAEETYPIFLNFYAYNSHNQNQSYTFDYFAQYITVDNSPPDTPSFFTSATSNAITVSQWSSYDAMSNTYTALNRSSGFNGIKNYTLTLKDSNGNVVGSPKTIQATLLDSYYNFTNLAVGTTYKVSVTATDLAGNSKSKEKSVTTVTPPLHMTYTARSYCHLTLAWKSHPDAVSYKLYDATETTPVLLSTITDTSFMVSGLTANTTYKFYVTAITSSGSETAAGNTLSVSTLTIPTPSVSGTSPICSSGATYTVTNLPNECYIDWDQGSGLSRTSASGNSATFKATGSLNTWITATINSGCGIESKTVKVAAGTPKPGPITIQWDVPPRRFTASIEAIPGALAYKWWVDGVLIYDSPVNGGIFQRDLTNCGHVYYIDVAQVNKCGTSPISHTEATEECGGIHPFTVYPNPATSTISITQNTTTAVTQQLSIATTEKSAQKTIKNVDKKTIKSIKVIDYTGAVYISKKYGKEKNAVTIDITDLKPGTYQIIVNAGTKDQDNYAFIKK
ncbi:MAG: hypothetical protein JXR65_02980 [Bacteroidales bacterium]|nr:hypothetical protein [Bacteroidales bacterium]